jgi:putative Mg2+ transporter-C (MgtC) family protein
VRLVAVTNRVTEKHALACSRHAGRVATSVSSPITSTSGKKSSITRRWVKNDRLTVTVLAVHLVPRPAGRLLDRAPAAGSDQDAEDVRATVHLDCDRRSETHIRALLLQGLSAEGLTATGLRARREDEHTTRLSASLAVSGNPVRSVEQLVTRLSLEPGVSDLHWHLDGEDQPAPEPANA